MRTREGLQSAGSRVGDPVSASKTVLGGFSPPQGFLQTNPPSIFQVFPNSPGIKMLTLFHDRNKG